MIIFSPRSMLSASDCSSPDHLSLLGEALLGELEGLDR
jgi:hypothetical protein